MSNDSSDSAEANAPGSPDSAPRSSSGSDASEPSAELAKLSSALRKQVHQEQKARRKAQRGKKLAAEALPIPAGMTAREAKRYAEEQVDKLLPRATQVLAERLEHGSRREQSAAASTLLRGRGVLGDGNSGGGGGPVIIVTGLPAATVEGGLPRALPWGGIVKGQVVPADDSLLPSDEEDAVVVDAAQSSEAEKP